VDSLHAALVAGSRPAPLFVVFVRDVSGLSCFLDENNARHVLDLGHSPQNDGFLGVGYKQKKGKT